MNQIYELTDQDTDMNSTHKIAKFAAEKNNVTADIPDWAKDKDAHRAIAYTGTISFVANDNLIKNPPQSWADILAGDYKVIVGDVGIASQVNNAVLVAAFANGGSENNIEPALKFFSELAKQGRLSMGDPSIANIEKGEVSLAILWDFNALNYRDKIDRSPFTVSIPQDGSVILGYTIIKYAKNPNAAKLTREYIFSDQGQINLAEGYARPIRSNVVLPESTQAKLINNDQYTNISPISDFNHWEKRMRKLPRKWQENFFLFICHKRTNKMNQRNESTQ